MMLVAWVTRRACRVNGEAAFDANYCWLQRIVVQAETLELLELTRLQCDNSISVHRGACHIDKVEKAARGSDTLYEVTFSKERREILLAAPLLLIDTTEITTHSEV
jgi:hypothetical protein